MVFIEALFWFVLAFLMAAVEIEIEGKYGWAEKTQTWYRKSGVVGRVWGFFIRKKPLTGYHLFLFLLILLFFHSVFFMGLKWSLPKELNILAVYFLFFIQEDFLWFVFNPYYTIKNYKKEKIWWFNKSYWIFGLFPIDYLFQIVFSFVLVLVASLIINDFSPMLNLVYVLLLFLLFTFVAIFIAPLYHKWYKSMRKKDDRKISGIFHKNKLI